MGQAAWIGNAATRRSVLEIFVCVWFGFWSCLPLSLTKRKSGWGICGSSWFFAFVVLLFVLICLLVWTNCVLIQTFSHSLCSCKDRASERHRPNLREKKRYYWEVDNLRLQLLCLCSFVCGCGPPYALPAWWTHIG